MEPQPGPSKAAATDSLSPVKKRPRKSLSATEKLMVMNVYKQTYKNWPVNEYWSLGDCAAKTATLLGISAVTVGRIVKEHKTTQTLSSPKKEGPMTNFVQKMDDFTMSAIRRIVHQFFRRNEAPTLKKVRISLNTYYVK